MTTPAHPYRPVMNRMGTVIVGEQDAFVERYVAAAGVPGVRLLEIGAAYGDVTRRCLAAGARCVANDLDARNLAGLERELDEPTRARLTVVIARFPDGLDFPAGSFDAVLASRVLHFLEGDELALAARRVFDWLVPGGTFIATAETPFRRNLEAFLPVYAERVARGEPWPGMVEDTARYFSDAANLPARMHFLDPQRLAAPFANAGFEIVTCETFSRPGLPPAVRLDGREGVGLIARRPAM